MNNLAPAGTADWHFFECPECGHVEEIDVSDSSEAAPNNICPGCGTVMTDVEKD